MANYHLSSKIISRSAGKSVVASAAYRACTQLHDNSIGVQFDYSNKSDLAFSEILSPSESPGWVSDREQLWNEVERVEKRKDSQLAREVEVSLPVELNTEQHINLINDFVNENFVNSGMIADINIHNKDGNPHAHVLLSLRSITPEGFGQKERSWNNKNLIHIWRKSWADIQNEHLAKAGFDISVDHRSYEDQGVNIEPQIHLGPLHRMDSETIAELDRMEEYKRISIENGNRIINDPTIAINHLAKNQAVFSNYDILKAANLYSYGQAQFKRVKEAIETHSELIKLGTDDNGNDKFTSAGMIESEEKMFKNVEALVNSFNHSVGEKYIKQAASQKTMTEEQDRAFNHVLVGSDLSTLIGVAGAGKSYVLGAVNDAYTAQGFNVQGCALAGIAAEGLQESSGIKSQTVTKLLWQLSHGKTLDKNSILVVDEAGMIGTKQMHQLLKHVENAGAKIVLIGDTEQTQSIAAGGAFRGIVERVDTAKISNVFRQETEWQKAATTEFSSKDKNTVKKAINTYNDHGFINFSATYSDAKDQLIKDWSESLISNNGESNIILAFKRDDVKELNLKARNKMIELGLLGKKEYQYTSQESIPDVTHIDHENENEISYKTKQGALSLSVNDRVMFTKNNYTMGVKNGSTGTVHGIRKNQISVKLDSGKTVVFDTRDYNDLTYGYASTINKTQGITVDRSFTLASTQFNKHLTYVAMSRHRKETNLYAGGGDGSNEKYCFENYDHLVNTLSQDRSKDLVIDYAYLRDLEPPEERIYSVSNALNNIENGNISELNSEILIKHLTRNDAVFSLKDLRKLSDSSGYDFKKLKDAILNSPELVKLNQNEDGFVYTSLNNINSEMNMFRTAEELHNQKSFTLEQESCDITADKWTLELEQLEAFDSIINDNNISSLVGYAGAGKSHLLGALNEAYSSQGFNVHGCALSGIAAQGLNEDANIKSTTIYRSLRDWNQGKNTLDDKSILVVDEAGLIGTTQMEQILKHAADRNAKVILAGDYQQLQSIATGGPFKGLVDKYGSHKLIDIRRQKNEWHKEATKEFAGNQASVQKGLSRYYDNGNIQIFDSSKTAKHILISDWKKSLTKDLSKTNAIFAHRKKDVEALNLKAREFVREMGFIDTQEFTFKTSENTNDADKIHLDDDLIFSPQDNEKSFSKGDRFLFLRNEESMGVKNGTLGTIVDINEVNIQVKLDVNNEIVNVEPNLYNEFTHGYATTIHKSQGATVDNSFVLASPQFDKHLTYVAMSRHKDDVNVYANSQENSKFGFKDKADFMKKMSQEKLKDLAVDHTKIPVKEAKIVEKIKQKSNEKRKEPFSLIKELTAEGLMPKDNEITKPVEELKKDLVMDAKMSIEQMKAEAKEFINQTQNEGKGGFMNAIKDMQNGITPGERVDELEKFKTQINLSEYAAYKGYAYDVKQSYRNIHVMKKGDEKISIQEGEKYWLYINRATGKNGTIIDFVQEQEGKNLGEVRKELRPWIGEPSLKPYVPENNYRKNSKPVEKNRENVLKEFSAAVETNKHPYLKTRGIDQIEPRFQGKVLIDNYKNAVFPHIDREGVCCLEKRNHTFKGMSKGGEKGLWCSHVYKGDDRLVLIEAPIDGLSYHELHGTENTRYIAFGGEMQEKQEDLLKSAINRMPDNAIIISATDQGDAGNKFSEKIKGMMENKTHEYVRHAPTLGNDWNAELTNIKGIEQGGPEKEQKIKKGLGLPGMGL